MLSRLCLLLSATASLTLAQSIDLSGTVLNRHTKKPISGIAVALAKQDSFRDTTGNDGKFSLSNAVAVRVTDSRLQTIPGISFSGKNILLRTDLPGLMDIKIFDVSGRRVFSVNRRVSPGKVTLVTPHLSTGLYVCRVKTSAGSETAVFMATAHGPLRGLKKTRFAAADPQTRGKLASAMALDTITTNKNGCTGALYEVAGYTENDITILVDTLSAELLRGDLIEQKVAFHVFHNGPADSNYVSGERLHAQVAQLNKAFHAEEEVGHVTDRIPMPVEFTLDDSDIRYIDLSDTAQLKALDLDVRPEPDYRYDDLTKKINKKPEVFLNVIVRDYLTKGAAYECWDFPEPDLRHGTEVNPRVVTGSNWKMYNQGDILTHEVGHYYGLHHVEEGLWTGNANSDEVDDTPGMYPFDDGRYSHLLRSDFTAPKKYLDKFRIPNEPRDPPVYNYMNAGHDRLRREFTPGQVHRMMRLLYKHKPVFMKRAKWKTFEEWKNSLDPRAD